LYLAKILLVALDIYLQQDHVLNQPINHRLQQLFNTYNTGSPDWQVYASNTKKPLNYQGLRQNVHLIPVSLFFMKNL